MYYIVSTEDGLILRRNEEYMVLHDALDVYTHRYPTATIYFCHDELSKELEDLHYLPYWVSCIPRYLHLERNILYLVHAGIQYIKKLIRG